MTIAQKLKITEFPFKIKHSNGKLTYLENSNGFWERREFDAGGNTIYYESSNRFWVKYEYDSKGNLIYHESSKGYWAKWEYDANGKEIYYEASDGEIKDNRPKTDIQKAIELLTKAGLLVDGKVLK
jgi:hypothetical protein